MGGCFCRATPRRGSSPMRIFLLLFFSVVLLFLNNGPFTTEMGRGRGGDGCGLFQSHGVH